MIWIMVLCSTTFLSANSLISTKIKKSTLWLTFAKSIKTKDVKYFVISANGFTKYVYDIKNGHLPKGKTTRYSHPDFKAFRIGQYRANILRIVIESEKDIKKRYSISGRVLRIPIPSGKNSHKQRLKKEKDIKKKYKIVIDAGHGGRDNGASCCSLHEKQFTLSMSYNLKKRLEKKGYTVYMTRSNDTYVSLLDRTKYANKKKADIFISIHVNAAPKNKVDKLNGMEVFYLSLNNVHFNGKTITHKGETVYYKDDFKLMTDKKKIKKSHKLSINIQKGMNRHIKKRYKKLISKIKRSDFWVLTGTIMPTVLIETGYITHKKDRKRLTSSYYKNLLVKGIVEGIDKYFKL
jgi:N-acetylmuramoyl-L-alanine amidase